MLEELIVAILISVVIACIVFYGVQLKGQWVAFWLVYLVTLACGVGESPRILVFKCLLTSVVCGGTDFEHLTFSGNLEA